MKKIPDHAKRVYKGDIWEVYQWDQEEFDGNTKVYERVKRSDTVIVIPVTEDGKLILIEEEQPHFDRHLKTIAGRVDPGETPNQAAKRELLEETGYESNNLIPWYKYEQALTAEWTFYTFVAKGSKKVADQKLEGGERITPIHYTFDQFIEKVSEESFPNLPLKVRILEAKLDPKKMQQLKALLQ